MECSCDCCGELVWCLWCPTFPTVVNGMTRMGGHLCEWCTFAVKYGDKRRRMTEQQLLEIVMEGNL